jgi:molecular chaperone DnaK
MGVAVGIDLGTTNSVIARVNEHGLPEVIPNAEGSPITPSVICFHNGEVIVGEEAKELQRAGTGHVAAFFKRQMGNPAWIFFDGERDRTAVDLSRLLLERMKADAEAALGEPITDAVITVPAYFKNPHREATIRAGREAGFNVLQVINEPTAAAIAYGLKGHGREQRILVYDLGGGTFDVTLMLVSGEEIRVLNSGGDSELGGKDWDDRIVEYLGAEFQEEHGCDPFEDAESIGELLAKAEETKKRLSQTLKTRASITHDGHRGVYELDRELLKKLSADLMERTISISRKALEDTGSREHELDGVLLVGGSTRMPMVHEHIEHAFGKPPMQGVNVDQAVALGAAIAATERMNEATKTPRFALRGSIKTVDVTNHSLGMIAINEARSAYVNSIILPKNTSVPCVQSRPYQHRTRRGAAGSLDVYMTQGESERPGSVTYLGKYVLDGIPSVDSGLAVIDVEYSYDLSATVHVSARERSTSRALSVTVEPLPHDVPARFLGSPAEQVERQHVTVYLVIDTSISMGGEPLDEAKKAALGFLENIDLSHCSMGVISFSNDVHIKIKASQNAGSITSAIKGLCARGGTTGRAIETLLSQLEGVEGRRVAVILTDGQWNDQEDAVSAAKACHDRNIDIVAIGFGSADKNFLSEIASSDEASFFTSLSGLVETFSNIAQILTETGSTEPQNGRRGRLRFWKKQ